MIIILLVIIVCVLLFGKENTKSGIVGIVGAVILLGLLGSCLGSCS